MPADSDTGPLPEVSPDCLARKLTKSKEQLADEAYEDMVNQKLVHDWLVFQCQFDPELREIYELYIGPVPGIV